MMQYRVLSILLVSLAAFIVIFGIYAVYFGMAWGFGWLAGLPILLVGLIFAGFLVAAARGIW